MTMPFVGDLAVDIVVDTFVSLIGTTTRKLMVKKPSGGLAEWTCGFSGTTLTYTTAAGDFDEDGDYRVAAYVEFGGPPATSKHTGRAFTLTVGKIYKD